MSYDFKFGGPDHRGFTSAPCLQSLWFPKVTNRGRNIKAPATQTCTWLFEESMYKAWLTGESRKEYNGLPQPKGEPGAGKSVLMKEAYRRALQDRHTSGNLVGGFFFNGKGTGLERSNEGALRSLLYQLIPQDRPYLSDLVQRPNDHNRGLWAGRHTQPLLSLRDPFSAPPAKVTPAKVTLRGKVGDAHVLGECAAQAVCRCSCSSSGYYGPHS